MSSIILNAAYNCINKLLSVNNILCGLLFHSNNIAIALDKHNQDLQLQNKSLQNKVDDLTKQLKTNSGNSSQSPSTDKPSKKPRSNNRIKTNKKSGGQIGHKGGNLKFVTDPNRIDETVVHKPTNCSTCGAKIENLKLIDTRQQHDIVVKTIITNHELYNGICSCGCETKIEIDVPHGVSYGNTIKSNVIYLSNNDLIPSDRLTVTVRDIFHLAISESTIYNWSVEAAEKLAKYNSAVAQKLLQSVTCHADESGMKVNTKNYWLHVFCNEHCTIYDVHPKRGGQAINEIGIINNFKGNLITDAYSSYFAYNDVKTHALCNAHLLRELKSVTEFYKLSFAQNLHDLLLTMNKERNDNKTIITNDRILELRNQYDSTIKIAESEVITINHDKWRKKANALINRLKKRKDNYLAFLSNTEVPFTNNQAERDIRMIKVKQKISGGFRKLENAKQFLAIRGSISTMKKLGKDVITQLGNLIKNPANFDLEPINST